MEKQYHYVITSFARKHYTLYFIVEMINFTLKFLDRKGRKISKKTKPSSRKVKQTTHEKEPKKSVQEKLNPVKKESEKDVNEHQEKEKIDKQKEITEILKQKQKQVNKFQKSKASKSLS